MQIRIRRVLIPKPNGKFRPLGISCLRERVCQTAVMLILEPNRASMSASGINIRGRSRKLYLNYRTTEEIRRLAVATLEGCEVDDLDDGSDEVKRYKSLSHGAAPMTLNYDHLDEALAALPEALKTGLAETRSVCVIVPSRHDANAVHGHLKSASTSSVCRSWAARMAVWESRVIGTPEMKNPPRF